MQQKNNAENFFVGMQAKLKEMMTSSPIAAGFDMKSAMEAQRKNMQAFAEANEKMMTTWQNLAKRQVEIMGQIVEDNTNLARESMVDGTPAEKFSRQSDIMKSACEKTMSNSQELVEMMRQSSLETTEVISKRLMDCVAEMQNSASAKK